MKCSICNSNSNYLFTKRLLKKYQVKYYLCNSCSFLQTEKPYWLNEAYKYSISILDTGILKRNFEFSQFSEFLINNYFNCEKKFLDFSGGYGVFTRLMRDKGYDFYRTDPKCKNIFSLGFDSKPNTKYELVTCFEVFEHFSDVTNSLKEVFDFSKNLLFSTELYKENNLKDWWYLLPESGQHLSFYSLKTLQQIAKIYNLNFYTNGINLHLFTEKILSSNPFLKYRLKEKIMKKFEKILNLLLKVKTNDDKSLIQADFKFLKRQYSL